MSFLDKKWNKFEEQHERLRNEHWDELKSHDYLTMNLVEQVEEIYLQQRVALTELEQSLETKRPQAEGHQATASESVSSSRASLPRIQLPHLSGRYEDWPAFRDLFSSLICQDALLSNVEKLHYLKVTVKGTAEQLIRNLPVTDANFQRAWNTLSDHFENKRLLVRSYLSAFIALPKMRSESAADLRKIFHGMVNTVGSLEGIGRPITNNNDLFIHMVVELMDSRTRREWEHVVGGKTEPPTYEELYNFTEKKLRTLEALSSGKSDQIPFRSQATGQSARALHVKALESQHKRCPLCTKNHYILYCERYKARSAKERKDTIDTFNLCANCLGRHATNACKSSKSYIQCSERHHTSVHDAFVEKENTALVSCATANSSYCAPTEYRAILLATARVKVADRFGNNHEVGALIDPGSETSLIAESLVRLLIPRSKASVTIVGVGGKHVGVARGQAKVTISSRFGVSVTTISALVMPRLTSYGEKLRATGNSWPHLDDLELADPGYLQREPVELLLGTGVFAYIVKEGLQKGRPGQPIAQRTSLGWIVSGGNGAAEPVRAVATLQCSINDELLTAVRKFWEQEEAYFTAGLDCRAAVP